MEFLVSMDPKWCKSLPFFSYYRRAITKAERQDHGDDVPKVKQEQVHVLTREEKRRESGPIWVYLQDVQCDYTLVKCN